MTVFQIALLVLMGVVFALWVFLMFRMLGRLTRQSVRDHDRTGGGFAGWIGSSLKAFGGVFSDPSVASERRQLLWVTILLGLIIIAQPLLLAKG